MIEATSQAQARTRAAKPAVERGRLTWGGLTLAAHAVLMYMFLYVPIVILVIFSFTRDEFGVRWTGFTLDWYVRLFNNERLMGAALNTLYVAFISTLVSTILGTLTALAMERYRFRGRTGVDAVLYLPIVIPEIVMAVALLAFSAFAFDLINAMTGQVMRRNLTTVIIAHIAFSISFVVVVVRTSLKNFDRRLEEAAADLGADAWNTFWRVTFPLILPGIIGGALLAFTLSLDDFIITFFTTGPGATTLPIYVYGLLRRVVTPEVNALSTIWILVVLVVVGISQWFQNRD